MERISSFKKEDFLEEKADIRNKLQAMLTILELNKVKKIPSDILLEIASSNMKYIEDNYLG